MLVFAREGCCVWGGWVGVGEERGCGGGGWFGGQRCCMTGGRGEREGGGGGEGGEKGGGGGGLPFLLFAASVFSSFPTLNSLHQV